jgi:hypothetical protein
MTTTFTLSASEAITVIDSIYAALASESFSRNRVEVVKLVYMFFKANTPNIHSITGINNRQDAYNHFTHLLYGYKKSESVLKVPPSELWKVMVNCHMNRLYKNPAWKEDASTVIPKVRCYYCIAMQYKINLWLHFCFSLLVSAYFKKEGNT